RGAAVRPGPAKDARARLSGRRTGTGAAGGDAVRLASQGQRAQHGACGAAQHARRKGGAAAMLRLRRAGRPVARARPALHWPLASDPRTAATRGIAAVGRLALWWGPAGRA